MKRIASSLRSSHYPQDFQRDADFYRPIKDLDRNRTNVRHTDKNHSRHHSNHSSIIVIDLCFSTGRMSHYSPASYMSFEKAGNPSQGVGEKPALLQSIIAIKPPLFCQSSLIITNEAYSFKLLSQILENV